MRCIRNLSETLSEHGMKRVAVLRLEKFQEFSILVKVNVTMKTVYFAEQ
jgi:hypothetical protein